MNLIEPIKAINRGYQRVQIDHESYNRFLDALEILVGNIREKGQIEEEQKNNLTTFLHDAFYGGYNISAVDNMDLAIRIDGSSRSNVGVIFEFKEIGSPDMPTTSRINTKAIRQLLLYYLRQRSAGNLEIRHLVITNTREFFIIDSKEFERLFYNDKELLRKFKDFEEGKLSIANTDEFYKEIAAPAIAKVENNIRITYFSLKDYKDVIRRREMTGKLTYLYKLLSPVHLLKQTFQNDSNTLNDQFYKELLHIIGLEENREGNKTVIQRKNSGGRDNASLLENTIDILETDSPRLPQEYGVTHEERYFNAAMELCIVWINRVLFLKLLEAQLLNYHENKKEYQFLTYDKIKDFDELNELFFQVMAKEESQRKDKLKAKFPHVPYLNSSLFETSEIERLCIKISGLGQSDTLKIMTGSVLRKDERFKNQEELPFLEYLFAFLDAYNFSSEGTGDVAEKPKTLINASVLGLIFEKINGYREGSVFTPGFITKYICSSSIRKTIVKKFNEQYGWELKDFNELLNAKFDLREANEIINSIKICDPAVGSGHFLVSALNEIILIKSELGCLFDTKGQRISTNIYDITVENDELIITEGENIWHYNPNTKEGRRIQEALFNEKRTIIENCLFGVDINPNSVNICRLRLWIELLKSAYYTPESNYTKLETLPNIDINIKCGNSVLQKFGINDQLEYKDISLYRNAVKKYIRTKSKEDKADIEELINKIKVEMTESFYNRNPLHKEYIEKKRKLFQAKEEVLFTEDQSEDARKEDENRLIEANAEFEAVKKKLELARSNQLYKGSMEWRMEFPEVLNDKGEFIGFDLVIGNPPYISVEEITTEMKNIYKQKFKSFYKRSDLFGLFVEMGLSIAKNNGVVMMIMPSVVHSNLSYKKLRDMILNEKMLAEVCYVGGNIFKAATVDTTILQFEKQGVNQIILKRALDFERPEISSVPSDYFSRFNNVISVDGSTATTGIYEKLFPSEFGKISDYFNVFQGIVTGNNPAFIFDEEAEALEHFEMELLHPVCHGRDIGRYEIRNRDRRLAYIDNEVNIADYPRAEEWLLTFKDVLDKRNVGKSDTINWSSLHRPRKKSDLDVREKILVQSTRNEALKQRIVATIDNQSSYGSQGVNFIIPSMGTYDLYCLLGILNSKLINYLFATKFLNLAIKAEYIKEVKIPPVDSRISSLVKEILNNKRVDVDTKSKEDEIDALVYKLYGLTYDEVKILDPETSLTREIYDTLN